MPREIAMSRFRPSTALVGVAALLSFSLVSPAHADPETPDGGTSTTEKGDKPPKDKPPKPPKDDDNYSASIVTAMDINVDGLTGGAVVLGEDVSVEVRVLSDLFVSGQGNTVARRVEVHGTVSLEVDGRVVDAEPVRKDGTAEFVVPAQIMTEGDHQLAATFQPAAGSHFQASSASVEGGLSVLDCAPAECQEFAAEADVPPISSDPTMRWMAAAALLLLGGAVLLWGATRRRAATVATTRWRR